MTEASGGEAKSVRPDVTQTAHVEALVSKTVENYGKLDAASYIPGQAMPADGGCVAQ